MSWLMTYFYHLTTLLGNYISHMVLLPFPEMHFLLTVYFPTSIGSLPDRAGFHGKDSGNQLLVPTEHHLPNTCTEDES